MAVSKRVRFEVLRRDGHTCRYCGDAAPDVKITVDHVVPTALGGKDDPSNLVAACRDCNAGKSSIAPDQDIVADVDHRALELAAALERAAAKRRVETKQRIATVMAFDEAWKAWRWGQDNASVPRDPGWMQTVERWIDLGLELDELTYYIQVAMTSKARVENKWRYMCGCAWNELTRRQDLAYDEMDDHY